MLKPGDVLDGKYRITRQIGEGGMGAVYAGENTRVKKTVAIKVLHKGGGGVADAVARFEREAQAAGTIGSDHIVEVYDLGTTSDGERFMVMEYLDGESLRDRLKRGSAVAPTDIIPIVLQLLDGLAAAHAADIVHRDLKPDNIFILKEKAGRADFVKILDFGISKFLNMTDAGGAMTRTGMVMGSPNYMSPEQVKSSNDVDGRSDLYTVGVILFEAVTGHVPFKAPTFTELLFKIVYEPLPHPCSINTGLDPAFGEILRRACASNRADRFQTARDFATALLAYLGYVPSPATNAGIPSVRQTALGVGDTVSQIRQLTGQVTGAVPQPASSRGGLPRMGLPPMAPPPKSAARPHTAPASAPKPITSRGVGAPSAGAARARLVPLAELTFDEPSYSEVSEVSAILEPADPPEPYPVIEEGDGDRTVALPNATPSGPFPSPLAAGSGALAPPAQSGPRPNTGFAPPPNAGLAAPPSAGFAQPRGPGFPPPPDPSFAGSAGGAPQFNAFAPPAGFAMASPQLVAHPSAPAGQSSVESPSGSFVFGQPPASTSNLSSSGMSSNLVAPPSTNVSGNQSGGFVAPEVPHGSQSGGFMPNTFGAVHIAPREAPSQPAESRRSSNKLLAFVAGLALLGGTAVGTIFYLRGSSFAPAPPGSSSTDPSTASDPRSSPQGGARPSVPASATAPPSPEPNPGASATPEPSAALVLSAEPSASAAPTVSAAASAPVVPRIVPVKPKPDEQLGY